MSYEEWSLQRTSSARQILTQVFGMNSGLQVRGILALERRVCVRRRAAPCALALFFNATTERGCLCPSAPPNMPSSC